MKIEEANINDLPEILKIQKIAFQSEAELYNNFNIQPLRQTLEEIEKEFNSSLFLKAILEDKIIGSVRSNVEANICCINKLIVLPEYQNMGIGKKLVLTLHKKNNFVKKYKIATGNKSKKNIYLYQKLGYKIIKEGKFHDGVTAVFMEKINNNDDT